MVLVADDDHCYTRSDLKCMNMLRHPIWVFDVETMSMYWANLSALVVWDATTLDELVQRDFVTDMSDSAKSWVNDFKAHQMKQNEYKTEKWTYYPRGIGAQILDVTFSSVRIDDGRIAILAEAEILEDKRTISDSTARSIEILKHLPVAVSEFSMDGKLIYQNPKACKLFGALSDNNPENDKENSTNSEEKLESNNTLLQRFVDVELGKTALVKIQDDDIFCAEAQQYTQQANETSADSSRWFNVVLRRARDPVTSDFVILYIARDISDIVKARKDTMQAAMKSEFLDVMAHEIRTPLHQIVGFVDLLEDSVLDFAQMNIVQQIQSSCSLLISIINDLLDCSKLEHGKLQTENLTFSLHGLVNGCIASIGPQARSKGLNLVCNIDSSCSPTIITDPNRLRQILHNLLSNAVKFTSSGSIAVAIMPSSNPVTSNTQRKQCKQRQKDIIDNVERWIRFEVTDTGIGIDPNEQKVVFERYRQANASVARHFGGTGLGLPICKALVELLGGSIELKSEVGRGTSVAFEIPILEDQKEKNVPSSNQSTLVDKNAVALKSLHEELASLNILIVEDNIVNQKVMMAMLQRLGHSVTLAENGEIALDQISRQQFHVVLMDIQMPVMDGVECTKKIRNELHLTKEQLPIIGLTAGFQNSDREFYENDVGMNDCLGKPLPMEKLKQAISFYQSDILDS